MNTLISHSNLLKIKDILSRTLYLLMLSPLLFILVNKLPYLLVISVIFSLILGLLFFLTKMSVTSNHREILGVLLIIFGFIILSYFFSGQNIRNFFSYSFIKNDGNFFFCYIMFFAFSTPLFDFRKLADFYFKLTFTIFTFFSVIGIAEYFLDGNSIMVRVEPYGDKMFYAFNFAHNATGSVYAMVCIFLLVFFLKESKNKIKLWYLLLLLINLVALFITKSRGSYIGFAAGAIVVLLVNYRSLKKFFIAIGAMILALIPIIFATGVYKRISQLFDLEGGTNIVRIVLWKKAWYLFSQSPLLGIGFGRFNDIFSIDRHIFNIDRLKGINNIIEYYPNSQFFFDTAHAHNSYLQFLTETGIVGMGLLLLFWVLCKIKLFNAYYSTNDEFSSKTFLSAIGSIFMILILALSENYLSATTIMIPMSMLISISIGLYWQENILLRQLNSHNDI